MIFIVAMSERYFYSSMLPWIGLLIPSIEVDNTTDYLSLSLSQVWLINSQDGPSEIF